MHRLDDVFRDAVGRVTTKGKQRHGSDSHCFDDQPIFQITNQLGADDSPLLFQAVKKVFESRRLEDSAARDELLDAIIYIACAVIYRDSKDNKHSGER